MERHFDRMERHFDRMERHFDPGVLDRCSVVLRGRADRHIREGGRHFEQTVPKIHQLPPEILDVAAHLDPMERSSSGWSGISIAWINISIAWTFFSIATGLRDTCSLSIDVRMNSDFSTLTFVPLGTMAPALSLAGFGCGRSQADAATRAHKYDRELYRKAGRFSGDLARQRAGIVIVLALLRIRDREHRSLPPDRRARGGGAQQADTIQNRKVCHQASARGVSIR
jgi:hypothetical protein